ncbi:MAG TPA: DUF2000 domain-containing protein [Mycobacteriales bacterium]|nr:DUF2000 domain-containing protein [Mycobacteriales bacterium]
MNDLVDAPIWIAEKAAVVVRDDLETWQKLNVCGFLTSGLGTVRPELIGPPYRDASGREYTPMLVMPLRVFAADAAGLRRAFDRATARDLQVAVFSKEMFETGDDPSNRAAVATVATTALDLVGIAVIGPRREVDKALDRARLHN